MRDLYQESKSKGENRLNLIKPIVMDASGMSAPYFEILASVHR
jgi:hypothetical protein